MNELNTQTPTTKGNKTPDLALKETTLNLLATVFAQGGVLQAHKYPEVSEMLASNNGGFYLPKYNTTK